MSARVSTFARQLPTYSGTKSYQNLLVEVYGGQESTDTKGLVVNSDSSLQLPPINLIRSGRYAYDNGKVVDDGSFGYYWLPTATSDRATGRLYFSSRYLAVPGSMNKGTGYTLRCLVR